MLNLDQWTTQAVETARHGVRLILDEMVSQPIKGWDDDQCQRWTALRSVETLLIDELSDREHMAAILEEERLEDERLDAEEREWQAQEDERRQAEYDHDSRFEYEYEDRLDCLANRLEY